MLNSYSASSLPVQDLKTFLDSIVFNYLIGNNDAHGKNFSLLYSHKNIRLAPLYDLVCTLLYPEITSKMAMKLGGAVDSTLLKKKNIVQMAADINVPLSKLTERFKIMSDKIKHTLYGMEDATSQLVEEIKEIIKKRCEDINSIF